MRTTHAVCICVALLAGSVSSATLEAHLLTRSVWYVDAAASPGGDGTSWATAFDTIQDAVDASGSFLIGGVVPLDQIWVRSGTYVLTAEIEVDKKEGLIVESDVANKNNDLGQFSAEMGQANETVGGTCETACGDAGFAVDEFYSDVAGSPYTPETTEFAVVAKKL